MITVERLIRDLGIRGLNLRLYYIDRPKPTNAVRPEDYFVWSQKRKKRLKAVKGFLENPFTIEPDMVSIEIFGQIANINDSIISLVGDNQDDIFNYLDQNNPIADRIEPPEIVAGTTNPSGLHLIEPQLNS